MTPDGNAAEGVLGGLVFDRAVAWRVRTDEDFQPRIYQTGLAGRCHEDDHHDEYVRIPSKQRSGQIHFDNGVITCLTSP